MNVLNPNIPSRLYQNLKRFEAEIVYEITKQHDGLPFGIAIADIQESRPHFHKVTWELYICVQGNLDVYLGEQCHPIKPGDSIEISPGVVHYARSNTQDPSRLIVVTIPEFSESDYYV